MRYLSPDWFREVRTLLYTATAQPADLVVSYKIRDNPEIREHTQFFNRGRLVAWEQGAAQSAPTLTLARTLALDSGDLLARSRPNEVNMGTTVELPGVGTTDIFGFGVPLESDLMCVSPNLHVIIQMVCQDTPFGPVSGCILLQGRCFIPLPHQPDAVDLTLAATFKDIIAWGHLKYGLIANLLRGDDDVGQIQGDVFKIAAIDGVARAEPLAPWRSEFAHKVGSYATTRASLSYRTTMDAIDEFTDPISPYRVTT